MSGTRSASRSRARCGLATPAQPREPVLVQFVLGQDRGCPPAGSLPRPPPRSRTSSDACAGGGADGTRPRCRTGAPGSRSRRRPRRCPRRPRSIPRGGPSPRPASRGHGSRRCVCSRSIESVATCTAVWNPTVMSVPRGRCRSSSAPRPPGGPGRRTRPPRPRCPHRRSRSGRRAPGVRRWPRRPRRSVVDTERVHAGTAEDRAAAMEDAGDLRDAEPQRVVLHDALPAITEAHEEWPWTPTPLRTAALMTALRPGQSPPPVRMPRRMRQAYDAPGRLRGSRTCSLRLVGGLGLEDLVPAVDV